MVLRNGRFSQWNKGLKLVKPCLVGSLPSYTSQDVWNTIHGASAARWCSKAVQCVRHLCSATTWNVTDSLRKAWPELYHEYDGVYDTIDRDFGTLFGYINDGRHGCNDCSTT